MIYVSGNSNDVASMQKVIDERLRITEEYCISKGWSTDPTKLTFDQIFEIRELETWKNAGK